MVGKALIGGQVKRDRPRRLAGGKDLWKPRLEIQRPQIPVVHARSFVGEPTSHPPHAA
jgi:hypothetical protein